MPQRHDVRLDGVTKEFDDITAVEDVDLSVETGKFLTLLGPSGCGKTTTLRCIAGFETPTTGDVYIRDERVTHLQPFERDTAMVFQSYALFPHMTVGENVAFGLQMQGIPDQPATDGGQTQSSDGVLDTVRGLVRRHGSEEIDARVAETLELVELPDMTDRDIEELSGGQQQRVALARALVTEPTVLLLDEPLGALDLKLRKNMQVELKNLQEELDVTFVYVTHDQEEALTMSDEVAVMNEGCIEQIGSASEIYEQPRTEFVADFIGETNLFRGTYGEDEDGAFVESGTIRYRVPPTEDATGDVAFAVRPEKLQAGKAATDLENSFRVTVIDEIYKGNLGKFVVRLDDGTEFTIDRQIRDESEYLSVGQSVTIGWERGHGVVLTE